MEGDNIVLGNAQRLERLVARTRDDLLHLDAVDRVRRDEVIGGFARYVELLREAAATAHPARYSFKLDFPDGRWDLVEQELTNEPRVGDLVWFDGSPWQIRGHRLVPRRPDPAHPHDFLACSPAT
jgi:hypothetical protein